jgi:hypothetical protein
MTESAMEGPAIAIPPGLPAGGGDSGSTSGATSASAAGVGSNGTQPMSWKYTSIQACASVSRTL